MKLVADGRRFFAPGDRAQFSENAREVRICAVVIGGVNARVSYRCVGWDSDGVRIDYDGVEEWELEPVNAPKQVD